MTGGETVHLVDAAGERLPGRQARTHTLFLLQQSDPLRRQISSFPKLPVLMSTYFRVEEAEECQMLFLSFPLRSFFFSWE